MDNDVHVHPSSSSSSSREYYQASLDSNTRNHHNGGSGGVPPNSGNFSSSTMSSSTHSSSSASTRSVVSSDGERKRFTRLEDGPLSNEEHWKGDRDNQTVMRRGGGSGGGINIHIDDDDDDSEEEDEGIDRLELSGGTSPPSPPSVSVDVAAWLETGKVSWTAYACFLTLGAGFLVPWLIFISAADYFRNLHDSIEFYFAVAYMYPTVVSVIGVLVYGHRFSFFVRIVPPFIIFALVTVTAALHIALFELEESAVWIFVALIAVTGLFDGLAQSSIYGLAGSMPPIYTQAVMNGNGLAGVAVSLVRIVTKISLPQTDEGIRISTAIFFTVASFFMIGCIFVYLKLRRLSITRHFLSMAAAASSSDPSESLIGAHRDFDRKYERERDSGIADVEVSPASSPSPSPRPSPSASPSLSPRSVPQSPSTSVSLYDDLPIDADDGQEIAPEIHVTRDPRSYMRVYRWRVMKSIAGPALSVCFTFLVTLSLIPGVATSVESITLGTWMPVLMAGSFCIADSIGRTVPMLSWGRCKRESVLHLASALRIVFIPLLFLCVKPHLITNEWVPLTLISLLGITGGYLGSMFMMIGPSKVNMHEREFAGTMMTLFLLLGLSSGATLGFLFTFYIFGSLS